MINEELKARFLAGECTVLLFQHRFVQVAEGLCRDVYPQCFLYQVEGTRIGLQPPKERAQEDSSYQCEVVICGT